MIGADVEVGVEVGLGERRTIAVGATIVIVWRAAVRVGSGTMRGPSGAPLGMRPLPASTAGGEGVTTRRAIEGAERGSAICPA